MLFILNYVELWSTFQDQAMWTDGKKFWTETIRTILIMIVK